MNSLRKFPWLTTSLAVFTLAIWALGAEPRFELTADEPWRLWTGHFTHWSADHLIWDLAVFIGLGAFCERRHRRATAWLLGPAAVVLSAPLLLMTTSYRGLSGLDSGLFALAACLVAQEAMQTRNSRLLATALIAATAFAAKSLFETITGTTLFVDTHSTPFTPLASAHLFGAAAGVAAFFLASVRKRLKRRQASPCLPITRRSESLNETPSPPASVRRRGRPCSRNPRR